MDEKSIRAGPRKRGPFFARIPKLWCNERTLKDDTWKNPTLLQSVRKTFRYQNGRTPRWTPANCDPKNGKPYLPPARNSARLLKKRWKSRSRNERTSKLRPNTIG